MIKSIKKIWERIKKMIYKGSSAVEDVHVGGQQIAEVYHGDTLVYQSSKIKYAGMSYVPARRDAQGNFVDGSNMTSAAKCLCLIRKDGAAKAIPFELSNENVLLAPTDEQIAAARWVAPGDTTPFGTITAPYPSNYDSGYWNGQYWEPAIAGMNGTRGIWSVPYQYSIRNIECSQIGITSTAISSEYTVTVKNGVCYIYYQGNLVRKIRDK